MKFEVNIEKKYFFSFLVVVLLLVGMFMVYATLPVGVTVGHDASDIYLNDDTSVEAALASAGITSKVDRIFRSKVDGNIKNTVFELSCPTNYYIESSSIRTLSGSTGGCIFETDKEISNAETHFGTKVTKVRVWHRYGGSTGGYSICELSINCLEGTSVIITINDVQETCTEMGGTPDVIGTTNVCVFSSEYGKYCPNGLIVNSYPYQTTKIACDI